MDELKLWSIPISEDGFEVAWGRLPDSERERALRFHHRSDSLRSGISRGALRTILGEMLGLAPQDVPLEFGLHGKPKIPGSRIGFNASHAGDWVWIAAVEDHEVGVDIEQIRPRVASNQIFKRFASPEEIVHFESTPSNDQDRAFFTWWTRKEAFMKGLGCGIAGDLRSSTVWLGTQEPKMVEDWSVHSLDAPPGYCGGLAVQAESFRVQMCEWNW
jgi:4'-phosphopantetheinyl transferase